MTVDDVNRSLDEILQEVDDPEVANLREDALYEDVLRAIAGGADRPVELAKAALTSKTMEFSRWYA